MVRNVSARLLSLMTCFIAASLPTQPSRAVEIASSGELQRPVLPIMPQTVSIAPSGVNPFRPALPVPKQDPDSIPAQPVPPPLPPAELARIEQRQRFFTEGQYIGVIEGRAIYRHNGRYLIEAANDSKRVKAPRFDASCVIRISGGNTKGLVASSEEASKEAPAGELQ